MVNPLVSVIIPHYNRVPRLLAAIASVHQQTMTNWEVVVVDDHSPEDPTGDILAAYPQTRVFRQERNGGPGAARNRGIDEARGRFIAFLDSDDHWEQEKLAAQLVAVMARPDPDRVLCATLTRVVEDGGAQRFLPERPVMPGERFAEFLYVGHGFAQSSSLFIARDQAMAIRFEERLRQYEDHLFFIAAGKVGLEYVLVNQPLVTWYNDSRQDRLTQEGDLLKGEVYLALGREALGEKAALAFQARFLGPTLFRKRPLAALYVFTKALLVKAINPRDILLLGLKILLPPGIYLRIRRHLARSFSEG